jgi:transcription elongation factor Elf1
MIEPMNCPFCGSSDVGAAGGQVHCYHCPVTLEVQNTNTFHAVELWNKRAADSEITSLKARVAEMESVIKNAMEEETEFDTEWDLAARKSLAGGDKGWLLRQKADAVDSIAENMVRDMTVSDIRMVASLHRQAADEADKAGGVL